VKAPYFLCEQALFWEGTLWHIDDVGCERDGVCALMPSATSEQLDWCFAPSYPAFATTFHYEKLAKLAVQDAASREGWGSLAH
jgi:hypothetical protein